MKMQYVFPVLVVLGLAVFFSGRARAALESPAPRAALDAAIATNTGRQTAVFAGGCFWGQQAVFERIRGVVKTTWHGLCGRIGGDGDVRSGDDGDDGPRRVSWGWSTILRRLLTAICCGFSFRSRTIRTQLNRQDNDVGTSYRSAIFYTNDEQRRIATAYIAQLEAAHVFGKPIVTQVTPLIDFLCGRRLPPGRYALKNPSNPYILVSDRPKVELLKKLNFRISARGIQREAVRTAPQNKKSFAEDPGRE